MCKLHAHKSWLLEKLREENERMRKQNYEVTFIDDEGMEIKERVFYTPEAVAWYAELRPHHTAAIKVEGRRDRSTLKVTVDKYTMDKIKDFLMI